MEGDSSKNVGDLVNKFKQATLELGDTNEIVVSHKDNNEGGKEKSNWEASAIGKVIIEGRMNYDTVARFIKFTWPFLTHEQLRIVEVEPNIMIFKFSDWDLLNTVIEKRPWNINKHLLVVHDYIPEMVYTFKHWGFQQFWIQLKFLLPEHMNVASVTKIGEPPSICPKCYVTNHCRGTCEAAAIFLAKSHEKPHFFGNVNNIRKTITTMSSSAAPEPKKFPKKYVKGTMFVHPKDGMSINMDFLLKEKVSDESESMEDLSLGKRLRSTKIGCSSTTATESSAQDNIQDTNSVNQETRMVTMGDNQATITQKKNQTKLNETKMKPLVAPYHFTNMRYLSSIGLSGGLVIMWKNGFFCEVLSCESNMIHLLIQDDPSQPEWLLSWDLNIHLSTSNTSASSSCDGWINSILQDIGLEDLGFIGHEHTWTNNNLSTGKKRSRIYIALGNPNWNVNFPSSKVLHLNQVGSDHCPIILINDYNQPKLWKTFKFFKTWLNDKRCAVEISKAWSTQIQGFAAFKLTKKLQFTRIALAKWNKKHFGDINLKVDTLQKELFDLQALPYSQETSSKAFQVNEELQKSHHIQHEFNKQKSIDNFLKDMDNNNKYFHSLYKRKRARNNIDSLKDRNGIWVHTRYQVANLLTENFQDTSTSFNPLIEERFYNHIPSIISDEDNSLLVTIPNDEEIFRTLKSMKNWSAPGPEGFQAGFYKSQWNIIGEDVCNMVKDFFSSKNMSRSLKKTYISLIPKIKKTSSPSEFRPISLCNTSYKIVSKILVSRMRQLMDRIISPYQAAYVSGRLINDNTIIAHEIIHSMKKKEGEGGWLALKLDMSKSFYRLEWSFILKVMRSFGFCDEWIQLIQQCITTTSISVLFNGSPCADFNPSRAHHAKEIPRIKAARGAPPINHLLFADDCLIFTHANLTSVNNLLQVIEDFGSQSDQAINFDKSSILFSNNLDPSFCDSLSHIIGVKNMENNEKYLGYPLHIGKFKVKSFGEINMAFERRLVTWQGETMCQAGRGTTVKAVLNVVPLYQMSTFRIPNNIIKNLDTLRRKFFWGISPIEDTIQLHGVVCAFQRNLGV
ncbi:uncharacterized protein LOC113291271 [Papaver somniferum]|uniref:uncharacterized protein LOC113291271 n=1 Tax=Papaver somniferum TaxID=3469 RepID=UPI000E6F9689|nr:uncharacterized protein LOC113291271 [Papaver somniferum]